LRTIAADAAHLGAAIGFLAVLNPWDQKLMQPRIFLALLPGGGIAPDENWGPSRLGFFLPVQGVGAIISGLASELHYSGSRSGHRDLSAINARCAATCCAPVWSPKARLG
jgi:hypothetical protein